MAMVVRVKPEYNGKIAVQSSNAYNGLILSNNIPQETLVQIYNTEDELRDFLYTTYTTVGDSYAPSQIDPSLIHAYASEEITHNPAKADYPANTVGKHLNETRGKIDAFDGAFVRPNTRPSVVVDFANSAFYDRRFIFSRASPATYIDKYGIMKIAGVNTPRFAHDPVTKECLGMLFEEPKTNYIPHRTLSAFTDGYWKKPINVQTEVGIMGDQNAISFLIDQINCSGGPNTSLCGYVYGTASVPVGMAMTASIYLKADTSCKVKLGTSDNYSQLVTVGTEWAKFEVPGTVVTGNRIFNVIVDRLTPGNVEGTRLYLDCPQSEEGNFSTSYIPPVGNMATERKSEICSLADARFATLFPNIMEGTLFVSGYGAAKNGNYGKYAMFSGNNTAGGGNNIGIFYQGIVGGLVYATSNNNGASQHHSGNVAVAQGTQFNAAFAWSRYYAKSYVNGVASATGNSFVVPSNINRFEMGSTLNGIIRQVAFWPRVLSEAAMKSLALPTIVGKGFGQIPSVGDLSRSAFISPEAILRSPSRQEFSVDCTGSSVSRNVRRDYDFTFEIVDSSGCTITATPPQSCGAGTDNPLIFSGPVGKTLTYAITPIYEY